MRTRIIVLIAVTLMLVLVLTACGAAPTATPQATATTAPTATKAPAAPTAPAAAPTATTAAPAATAPAAGAAPAISHDLVGRDNCLQCHGATGVKPFPAATHANYTNQLCQTCHKPKS